MQLTVVAFRRAKHGGSSGYVTEVVAGLNMTGRSMAGEN